MRQHVFEDLAAQCSRYDGPRQQGDTDAVIRQDRPKAAASQDMDAPLVTDSDRRYSAYAILALNSMYFRQPFGVFRDSSSPERKPTDLIPTEHC